METSRDDANTPKEELIGFRIVVADVWFCGLQLYEAFVT